MNDQNDPDIKQQDREQIIELGADITRSSKGNIYTLTIIGQVEGHQVLPENCKTTKTEEIEKHVHQYTSVSTDATCTEDAYTTYTCACGDTYKEVKTGTKGHNYSSMIYQPTCTEAGYILFTCWSINC